jgi:hypothetical protein
MKSIKQQYIDLREGRMTQANFMRSLRMTMPHLVTNVTSLNDSLKILKNKGILSEISLEPLRPERQSDTANVSHVIEKLFDGEYDSADDAELESARAIVDASNHPDKQYAISLIDDILYQNNQEEADADKQADFDYDDSKLDESTMFDDEFEPEINVDAYQQGMEAFQNGDNDNPFQIYTKEYSLWRQGWEDAQDEELQTNPPAFSLNENKEKGAYGQDGVSMYKGFPEGTHVNRQELTKGIKCEHEQNPYDEYDKIVKKVIKNLKKDPNYYTHYALSGVPGFTPGVIGNVKPSDRTMKFVKGGDMVDKAMGMKPVKDVEKYTASANKAHKEAHPNKIGKTELMSLIAKTVRGIQKMDATGEKAKKITIKEGMNNDAVEQAEIFIKSDNANPILKGYADRIHLQDGPNNTAILQFDYWDALPEDAFEKLELQFDVQEDRERDGDTGEILSYILRPKGNPYAKTNPDLSQIKELLAKLIREELAETFDGRDNLTNTAGDIEENEETDENEY